MKKKKKIQQKKIEEIPKGKSTFSVVDSDNVKIEDGHKPETPTVVMKIDDESIKKLAELLITKDKDIKLIDERSEPIINVNVEPTPVHIKNEIDVDPTPYEIKVPTQRVAPNPAPKINVENKTDLTHLIFLLYINLAIFSFIAGAIVWLLLMLSNSQS